MTTTAEDPADAFSTDLAALRRDIAQLTETMKQLLQHQAQAAGSRVSDAVDEAKDRIADKADDAQDRVRAARGEIEAAIERNPLTAVLIAFGIGMSFGMFGRSRG